MSDFHEADEILHPPAAVWRGTGDRVEAPAWFLLELLDRAAELLDEADLTAAWGDRARRWVEIWRFIKGSS